MQKCPLQSLTSSGVQSNGSYLDAQKRTEAIWRKAAADQATLNERPQCLGFLPPPPSLPSEFVQGGGAHLAVESGAKATSTPPC